MPLDTESLSSLRIERSNLPTGGNRTGLYVGIAVTVLVVVAGVWFFMRPKPTEVSTVVAEAESSGPSLGTSVLNASGYVVARRMATVSSKVTGKVLEILVGKAWRSKRTRCWRVWTRRTAQRCSRWRSASSKPRDAI
jgi:hypothetical protein